MSNIPIFVSKPKPCFGQFENWDNSWHCKGCPVNKECQDNSKEDNSNEA